MTQKLSTTGSTKSYALCWLAVAVTFISAAATLPFAPASVPTHWGMNGQPDRMGSSLFGLCLVPAIALVMQALALVIPRIDPGKKNYANFMTSYWKIFLAFQVYLLSVQLLICAWALGWPISMSTAMPLLVGSLLMIMGNYFGKLRPNWMIGIRTPWTLSSKRSWDKTHRLGGWLMIFMGAIFACLSLIHTPTSFIVVGIVCFVCVISMIVYSWYVWRNDPDRISAAGVSAAELDQSSDNGSRTLALCIGLGAALLWSSAAAYANDMSSASIELSTNTGKLSASLDMPTDVSGRVPLVLVLPGSGPTDCDGNSAGMKNDSLKLLGKAIASKGIAACRIDKRGIGRSAAAMVKESELSFETYVSDAVAWVKLLKSDPRFSQVHVIGHSEGSLVGILAAQKIEVASFVSVAGAGQRASDLMRTQLKSKIPETGMKQVETILAKLEAGDLVTELSPGLHLLFRPSVQPYLISWFRYDPVKEIAKLKDLPVLIVQGNTDIQCSPSDADTLASVIPSANKTIIAGMNHVLKKIEGETVSSQLVAYTDPSLPLHEQLVPTIVDFIRKR